MNTGKIIRKLRMQKNMTQARLAEICDLSTNCVNQYENRTNGRVDTFNKLLHGLGYELVIMKIHKNPKEVNRDCQW